MKLHLHIGAHKTATTHFQNVLATNQYLYPIGYKYIPMIDFRRNVTRLIGNKMHDFKPYLDEALKDSPDVIIVSEENICGETKDIFECDYLYPRLESRLTSLVNFIKAFDEVEVWFSIRAMDTFLPSMYCEYLRHFKFKPFDKSLLGRHHEQSWIPVIQAIGLCLPKATINIIQYENYPSNLPSIINHIYKDTSGWDCLTDIRHRESFNHFAIDIYRKFNLISPKLLTSFIKLLSKTYHKDNLVGKFSPFDQNQRKLLRSMYVNDLVTITKMKNVNVF